MPTTCLVRRFDEENGLCKPTSSPAQLRIMSIAAIKDVYKDATYPNDTRKSSNVLGTNGNKSNSVKHTKTLADLMAMMTAGAWVFLNSKISQCV